MWVYGRERVVVKAKGGLKGRIVYNLRDVE